MIFNPEAGCIIFEKALNPQGFAWFALSTFAGLRPDEARKTTWEDIHFEEGWIKVEAQTTKVRQRRVVYPLPSAFTWLAHAKGLGAKLPLTRPEKSLALHALRAVLGWTKWKHDVTRHTAASLWLAQSEAAEKVANALGHSERILRKNYLALVTKAAAEKFWALTPRS